MGDVCVFHVVAGNFDRLYDDDKLILCQLGSGDIGVSLHEVCYRLPLHVVTSFVPSMFRSQLIPCDFAVGRISVAELRSIVVRLCCAGSCKYVYAVHRRPDNCVVNPFHIGGGC